MNSRADDSHRALALIDAALEDGSVTAEDRRDRELQELALLLSDDAPAPDPDFAAGLAERVEAGFPRRRDLLAPRLRAMLPGRLTPRVAAVATSLLLAVTVATGLISRVTEAPEPVPQGAAEPEAVVETDQLLSTGQRAIAPATEAPDASPREELGERDRRIQLSALMTIAATEDRLDEAAAGIAEATRRNGGFVLNSTMTTGERDAAGGHFDLRVPLARLDAALEDISLLGAVRRLTRDSEDVTGSFATLDDRIRELRALRRSLVGRLGSAASAAEESALRARLRAVEDRLGRAQARERRLDRRVSFAAVSVNLERGRGDAGGALGEALDDAVEILTGGLGLVIRGLAVAVPLAVLGLLAWLAASPLRRRRREAVLR